MAKTQQQVIARAMKRIQSYQQRADEWTKPVNDELAVMGFPPIDNRRLSLTEADLPNYLQDNSIHLTEEVK